MSDPPHSTSEVVRFGTFEVDVRSGELRKAGVRIALQDQPLRVLTRLIQCPGEVVTREELQRELWPDNTFLDFEQGLNAAIKRLRDALGDSAESPRFVETLPRRGYRFIAPVVGGVTSADVPPPTVIQPRSTARSMRKAVVAVLALATIAAAAWWRTANPPVSVQPDGVTGASLVDAARVVVVAAFENSSNDSGLDPLGDQIAGRVVRAIAAVPGVAALPATGQGLAQNASLTVRGAFFLQGDRLELQSRIVEQSSGQLLHVLPPIDAPRADPGQAIERLEREVAGAIAIHFDEFFGGLEFVSQPPTIDGYREYRAGLEIFSWEYSRAVTHLERALEIDPQFWLPRVILLFAVLQHRPSRERPRAAGRNGASPWSPKASGTIVHRLSAGIDGGAVGRSAAPPARPRVADASQPPRQSQRRRAVAGR